MPMPSGIYIREYKREIKCKSTWRGWELFPGMQWAITFAHWRRKKTGRNGNDPLLPQVRRPNTSSHTSTREHVWTLIVIYIAAYAHVHIHSSECLFYFTRKTSRIVHTEHAAACARCSCVIGLEPGHVQFIYNGFTECACVRSGTSNWGLKLPFPHYLWIGVEQFKWLL